LYYIYIIIYLILVLFIIAHLSQQNGLKISGHIRQ